MSIEITKYGRHRVRLFVRGKRGEFGVRSTREEAEQLELDAFDRLSSSAGLTLGAWGADWLDARELDGVSDIGNERGRWRTHIASHAIARRALLMLTPADIETWLVELGRKQTATPYHKPHPISSSMVAKVFGLLVQCLDAAIPKHISSNPAAPLAKARRVTARRRAKTATVEPWSYLALDEQGRLLSCEAIPEAHRLILAFAMLTGLRQGEQFNLEIADVHVAPGDVPHVYVRFGSKGKLPKNGRARRVYLSPEAVEVTRRWLAVLPTWARSNREGLMFPTHGGSRCSRGKTPLHVSEWRPAVGKRKARVAKVDLFPGYLRAAGIARHVRHHDLRHTCASSLVAGWWGRRWTLEEVREQLGHLSIQSTARYAHLAESAIQKAVAETPGRPETRAVRLPASKRTKAPRSAKKPSKQVVGRQGLEPWTYGLKERSGAEWIRGLIDRIGQAGGQFAARARAALAAHDAGDPFASAMLARLLEEIAASSDAKTETA